jgi:hypothetical protein
MQCRLSADVCSPIWNQKAYYSHILSFIRYIPLTATIPVIGIHSLEPSGKMLGLLREGRASKCEWTSAAIRDGKGIAGVDLDIGQY